ncbi:MAG: hypothetical protein KBT35_04590 [Firmicutes bacterium]|nr:hypothetical protein [Candidatus Colivicinus equi]
MSKFDYIEKCNNAYYNLNEFTDSFYEEALIINHVKCVLLQNEELTDFNINGINVEVYGQDESYSLFFDDKQINVDVYDNMVVDYYVG